MSDDIFSELEDLKLREYYNQRAEVYEEVYAKPERQQDLLQLRDEVRKRLRDLRVLEIACGTGFWSLVIGDTAAAVTAIDQSEETLELASTKRPFKGNIQFIQSDAYKLDEVFGPFDAAFGGFWWSHVPHHRIEEFLKVLHQKVGSGARVLFIDNQFVEGSNHPISETDSEGNTYQRRMLPDGSYHRVLKNFPDDVYIHHVLAGKADRIEIIRLQYFWLLEYRVL